MQVKLFRFMVTVYTLSYVLKNLIPTEYIISLKLSHARITYFEFSEDRSSL